MKKKGITNPALVYPGATGWRVRLPGGEVQSVEALAEAAAAVPAGAQVHLALPCNAAILERMTLPSADRGELSGMVQLQLEKTLPFGVEEVAADFDVIRQGENEATLLSVAANHQQLDQLCEPLRNKALVPDKVTVYAQHVAASCPPEQTLLCAWPEDGQIALAICENGKLGYAQTVAHTDPAAVIEELPGFFLRAEMEGVPTEFAAARIEQGCGGLRDVLAEAIGKPVEVFSFDQPLPEPATNLVPASWIEEKRRIERSGQLRARLQLAAMGLLLLIAGAFLYLAFLKSKVGKLDAEIARTLPLVEFQQSRQTKWQELAPAIDPSRSAVEVLNLLLNARPSPELKFTRFEFGPRNFKLDGEAPNNALWTEFKNRIEAEAGLRAFAVNCPPPKFLNDDRVQFQIFGK
jgi:hypothetical protein